MRPYLAILKGRMSVLFHYRAAALAGFFTQTFWGFIKAIILTAFYAQTKNPQPLSLNEAITFIWIGQAVLPLLPWNIDKEIEAQIKNGNVAYELIRPLNIYWIWYFRSLAMRLVPTLLRIIPLFILAGLFFGLARPVSFEAGIAFGISLFLAALLSCAMTTAIIMTLFWTISGEGILRLLPHVVLILSGLAIPLPLFPERLQPFLNVQPFRFIMDVPCRLYTGVISIDQAGIYFGFQCLWILIFVIGGSVLFKKAMKKFVIQGG